MDKEENLFEGVFWASLICIPMWIALFGWLKIII